MSSLRSALREQRPVLDYFSEERGVRREFFSRQPLRQLFNCCRNVAGEF
jgi:hypothetical protein